MWVLMELVAMATDLAEFPVAALEFNLLLVPVNKVASCCCA